MHPLLRRMALFAPVHAGGRAHLRGLWVQGRLRVTQGRCIDLDLEHLYRHARNALVRLMLH